jgi:ribose 5-phosphate isomerase B
MKLWIAADHGGFELKAKLKAKFPHVEWVDLGTHSADSVDYPSFAQDVCTKILAAKKDEELLEPCAVLVCGSGVGVSIAANRFPKIRAVLAWSDEVAKLSRQHNAANVLCLGGRLISESQASTILETWLKTAFEGGRHSGRIEKIDSRGK